MDIKKTAIVTAIFDIGRDKWDNFTMSYHTYLWWMRNLLYLDTNLIIYTEERFKNDIINYRKEVDPNLEKTIIIIQPLESIEGYKTFFEPLIGKIVYPLFGQGFLSNFIISYLTSRPSEVIKSMSDCKLMTKLIAESVVEGMIMSLQRQKGFDAPGYSFLRNTLGDVIKGTGFISGIENSISSTVCELFGKFAENAEKVKSKLATD